jgi:hypothetical protein
MKRILALILFLSLLPFMPAVASAQTCVQGAAGVAPTATLSWTAPTLNTDGSTITLLPLTYNLYQGASATTLVKVASGITALTDTITTGLVAGNTYYWTVTVVDSAGSESAQTNPLCKSFPKEVPGTVVNLTIK